MSSSILRRDSLGETSSSGRSTILSELSASNLALLENGETRSLSFPFTDGNPTTSSPIDASEGRAREGPGMEIVEGAASTELGRGDGSWRGLSSTSMGASLGGGTTTTRTRRGRGGEGGSGASPRSCSCSSTPRLTCLSRRLDEKEAEFPSQLAKTGWERSMNVTM